MKKDGRVVRWLFVETCWRVWQEMIHKITLQDEAEAAANTRALKCQYDDGWKKHTTWGYGSVKTPQRPRSAMPWSQPSESTGRLALAQGQYVSPLSKRVRPGSSRADIGRPLSGRPISGQQRPFSASTTGPSPEYTRLFPPNQRQRLETNAQAQATHDVAAVSRGYEALGYILKHYSRDELMGLEGKVRRRPHH